MKREDLFDAIGSIDDDLIARSENRRKVKNRIWVRSVLASAACFVLVVSAVLFMNQEQPVTPIPPTDTTTEDWGDGKGGNDSSEVISTEETQYGMNPENGWVDYNVGPLMPLSLREENSAITATREMTYDFSELKISTNGYAKIKDAYVLKNTSDTEQIITVQYPYMNSMKELAKSRPTVVVNDETRDITINAEAYRGKDSSGMLCPFSPSLSSDEYSSLMAERNTDMESLNEALLNKPVTVYEFHAPKGEADLLKTAYYSVKFKVADINSVYFAGVDNYFDDGEYVYAGFYVKNTVDAEIQPTIIFMDGKPSEYVEQGYTSADGFIEQDKSAYETEAVTVEKKEYETNILEVMMRCVDAQLAKDMPKDISNRESLKTLYSQVAVKILSDILTWDHDGAKTGEDDVAIHFGKSLSDMAYLAYHSYALYVITDTVTIPAGESVTIEYAYEKQGNHQTTEPEEAFRDCYGYDNTISLGTNLVFTEQVAGIVENGNISIMEQNYGFDLENDVKKVVLDLDAERYYMIIKVLK